MSQQGTGAVSATDVKQGLRKDVDQIRDDIGRLGKDMAGTARDVAGAAKATAREAGAYMSDTVETVRERSQHTAETARETIENNPWASVGIAFGAGVLIGAILRRL